MKIRLDQFIAKKHNISRNKAQELIESKLVLVNQKIVDKKQTIIDDEIDIIFLNQTNDQKKISILNNFPTIYKKINIIFEHEDFIVIEKPPHIASHKAHTKDKNPNIADWFLESNFFNDIKINEDKRVGVVHRLDKETSGLMILARNYTSQQIFSKLFQDRKIQKIYTAITEGITPEHQIITHNIVRNPLNPTQMTCTRGDGRDAQTEIKRLNVFEKDKKWYSIIECYPKTGRTHQIRVHMKTIGFPLVGDKTYGHESHLIDRHALHASKLKFEYKNQLFKFESKIPEDMKFFKK